MKRSMIIGLFVLGGAMWAFCPWCVTMLEGDRVCQCETCCEPCDCVEVCTDDNCPCCEVE